MRKNRKIVAISAVIIGVMIISGVIYVYLTSPSTPCPPPRSSVSDSYYDSVTNQIYVSSYYYHYIMRGLWKYNLTKHETEYLGFSDILDMDVQGNAIYTTASYGFNIYYINNNSGYSVNLLSAFSSLIGKEIKEAIAIGSIAIDPFSRYVYLSAAWSSISDNATFVYTIGPDLYRVNELLFRYDLQAKKLENITIFKNLNISELDEKDMKIIGFDGSGRLFLLVGHYNTSKRDANGYVIDHKSYIISIWNEKNITRMRSYQLPEYCFSFRLPSVIDSRNGKLYLLTRKSFYVFDINTWSLTSTFRPLNKKEQMDELPCSISQNDDYVFLSWEFEKFAIYDKNRNSLNIKNRPFEASESSTVVVDDWVYFFGYPGKEAAILRYDFKHDKFETINWSAQGKRDTVVPDYHVWDDSSLHKTETIMDMPAKEGAYPYRGHAGIRSLPNYFHPPDCGGVFTLQLFFPVRTAGGGSAPSPSQRVIRSAPEPREGAPPPPPV